MTENKTAALDVGCDGRKTLTAQEYNCLKHKLPKSKIPMVLLHDNETQSKHLKRYLNVLQSRRDRTRHVQEQNIRAFVLSQKKKQAKWKKEDDFGVAAFNLPWVKDLPKERPHSMQKLYTAPAYSNEDRNPQVFVPLLPVMSLERSKTEIVTHRKQTICSKLPTVVEIDRKIISRYDAYRGSDLLVPGGSALKDRRFHNLTRSLSETKLETEHALYEPRPTTMPLPDKRQTRKLTCDILQSRFFKKKTGS